MAESKTNIAPKETYSVTPTWIKVWFVLSTLITSWDAAFCLLRPFSFTHWLWAPHRLYQPIDLAYSPSALAKYDGSTSAHAILTLCENVLNVIYLYMQHKRDPNRAILIGMTANLFTFWKATLYSLTDFFSGPFGWGNTGHNSTFDWWILFVLPNSFWIIVPFIISVVFFRELSAKLKSNRIN